MPDGNQASPQTTAPVRTARATVIAPPANHAPLAVHIPVKTRTGAIQRIKDLQPDGSNPAVLKVAQDAALALLETFDASVTGAEIKIESNAGSARQVMVLVIPHEL